MITHVKLVATAPRTFTFQINGIPACAVVINTHRDNRGRLLSTADVYCDDEHMTIHNVTPSWTPNGLQFPRLPAPTNVIIIQAQ